MVDVDDEEPALPQIGVSESESESWRILEIIDLFSTSNWENE